MTDPEADYPQWVRESLRLLRQIKTKLEQSIAELDATIARYRSRF